MNIYLEHSQRYCELNHALEYMIALRLLASESYSFYETCHDPLNRDTMASKVTRSVPDPPPY
jgi:hypothetical protein